MNWIPKFLRRSDAVETKAVDFSPTLWSAINGGWGLPTNSGQSVSTSSSLQNTAFYRAILVIAEGIAQLPVTLHKRSARGTEPAIDHPLYDVLLHRANNLQDAYQFFRTILMHAAGSGNGIAYKVVVNGQVRELIPIRPECVSINLPDRFNRVLYDLTFENGSFATVGKDDVFHIAGPSWSPYKGIDPSVVGREAIGLAQATESTHAHLHKNGARPSGVMETSAKLDKAAIDLLREQWLESFSGTANTGKTPILANGISWKQIEQRGVDTEHLDTRKHQIEEIARLIGVFPIMLGHAGDQSPTFASADAFLEAHVRYSLQPVIKAVRSAVDTQILTREERDEGYHCLIDTSELLRGSLKDRTEYYKAALGTNSSPGWLKPNEVREDDGWNPADEEEMDKVWQPATMAPVGQAQEMPDGADEAKSSVPRTLYVSRKLLNADEFVAWAKKQGFADVLPADGLHVTIASSRAKLDWMAIPETMPWDRDGELRVNAGGALVVEQIGKPGTVALKFASAYLCWRHAEIGEAGASWDFTDYQPHVTITKNAGEIDLAKVEPFLGELRFGPEIFEERKIDPTNGNQGG